MYKAAAVYHAQPEIYMSRSRSFPGVVPAKATNMCVAYVSTHGCGSNRECCRI